MGGWMRLSVAEPLGAGLQPRFTLTLATVGEYGCSNYTIALRQHRIADTVVVTLSGLVPDWLCDNSFGPAHGRATLSLRAGKYTLLILRGERADRVELLVTETHLALRPIGKLAFVQPDTSLFRRPAARSFFVSCGTPNVPELCDDLGGWLARQRGIVRQPLAADERIAFSRQGGYWQNDYRLFRYSDDGVLDSVRRCIRQLADTLKEAVGAGVTVQTAEGEVMRAWSQRALHERHIAVPHKISGSSGCPGA